jgi:hypothetical protein
MGNNVSEDKKEFKLKTGLDFGIYLHLRQTTLCTGKQISLELRNQVLRQKI